MLENESVQSAVITLIGTVITYFFGDKAWKYWKGKDDNKTKIKEMEIEVESQSIITLNARLTELTTKYDLSEKLHQEEKLEAEERYRKERLDSEERHRKEKAMYIAKVNKLETTIKGLQITLNLFIASLKDAAEKDPALANFITAIEENQKQFDEKYS